MKDAIPYLTEHPDRWVKGRVLAEIVYGPGGRMQRWGFGLVHQDCF
jgi:hypothetical protein